MLTPLAIVLALAGAAWGFAADRIAARWPQHVHEHVHDHATAADHEHPHDPGDEPVDGRAWEHEHPHAHDPVLEHGRVEPRRIDWRTAIVVVVGGFALGALTVRFSEPVTAAVFGAYLVALVMLLATDLDQRRLPDVITLPAIPIALLFSLLGLNPLVPPGVLPIAIAAAVVLPGLLYLASTPIGRGAFGQGDVKLLVSVGLMVGPLRLLYGVVYGALLAGIVLAVLLAVRRITLKSYVPYGPFLIVGGIWAVLVIQ